MGEEGTVLAAEVLMPFGQEGAETLQGGPVAGNELGQRPAAGAEISKEFGDGLQSGGGGGGWDQLAVGIDGLEDGRRPRHGTVACGCE